MIGVGASDACRRLGTMTLLFTRGVPATLLARHASWRMTDEQEALRIWSTSHISGTTSSIKTKLFVLCGYLRVTQTFTSPSSSFLNTAFDIMLISRLLDEGTPRSDFRSLPQQNHRRTSQCKRQECQQRARPLITKIGVHA